MSKRQQDKMKMSALLVAMSVGASIVIADDSQPLQANIEERTETTHKRMTFLRRCRGLARKTIELGKDISYKTANATIYIRDRIGSRISKFI